MWPSGGSGVFIIGGHWGGHTFIWGHTTNTVALNYRVCNVILASDGIILNFLGGTGRPAISLGAAPPAPLGTAPTVADQFNHGLHRHHGMS